jgi:hypothetical protein
MSGRVKELAERERRLQERCAAQRASVAREMTAIEARFEAVDRMAGLARNALLHPAVIAGGVVALLTIGRLRGMRLVGRLYLLTTAARRLMQVVRTVSRVSAAADAVQNQRGRL